MHDLFRGVTVVPVLTIEREADAMPLARALFDGGLRLIEITLRTPAAPAAIAAIAQELPQVVVGAGTLQRPADIVQACTAGARFLVSPGMTPELAAAALATELPYIPGVATPSEVMAARDLGISFLKLFPAESLGGLALLRALAPVFQGVAFCPTGGIDEHSAGRVSGAAERRDGRWLVDGPQGCRRGWRLVESTPSGRARSRHRPPARRLGAPNRSRADLDYRGSRLGIVSEPTRLFVTSLALN